MESTNISQNERGLKGLFCENINALLIKGCQYLFETLHDSLTVKNNRNVVKRSCFEKPF